MYESIHPERVGDRRLEDVKPTMVTLLNVEWGKKRKHLQEEPGRHWLRWVESVHKGMLFMSRLTCYKQGRAYIVQTAAKASLDVSDIASKTDLTE